MKKIKYYLQFFIIIFAFLAIDKFIILQAEGNVPQNEEFLIYENGNKLA